VPSDTTTKLQLDAQTLEAIIVRAVEATLERLGQAGGNGQAAKPVGELLSQPQSWAFVGVTRSVWFRLRAEGKLPPPVGSATGNPRWRRSDLQSWVARLKPASRRPRPRRG
jgi:predicted DNA-binding transcriptional regulator AlpA